MGDERHASQVGNCHKSRQFRTLVSSLAVLIGRRFFYHASNRMGGETLLRGFFDDTL